MVLALEGQRCIASVLHSTCSVLEVVCFQFSLLVSQLVFPLELGLKWGLRSLG